MIFREFLTIAAGNLWRLKLRSALTISGVMIGIGALVSMLSLGHGMQTNLSGEFRKMGLQRTIQVLPQPMPGKSPGDSQARRRSSGKAAAKREGSGGQPDSSAANRPSPPLDRSALEKIAALKGVALVYPQQSFDAQIHLLGRDVTARVQALPAGFTQQRPFGTIQGRFFSSDSAGEVVLTRTWLARNSLSADSVLGRTLTVRSTGSGELLLVLAERQLERLSLPAGGSAFLHRLGEALIRLFFGSTQRELTVVGITDFQSGFGFNMGNVLIPIDTAAQMDHLSFSDPMQLLSMLSAPVKGGWPMLVVTVTDERVHASVRARIEEMGFHTFSFLDQFDEIRKSFLLFDALVGAIGFLALFIAALGIVNTMVMSIVERTREIGVLKSLGAEEGQIRLLFLVESGMIGGIGSLAGLLLGYGVSRLGSFILRRIMIAKDVPAMDMFSLSPWIALGAISFGVALSLAAGLYPAARAARVDPVQALRHE